MRPWYRGASRRLTRSVRGRHDAWREQPPRGGAVSGGISCVVFVRSNQRARPFDRQRTAPRFGLGRRWAAPMSRRRVHDADVEHRATMTRWRVGVEGQGIAATPYGHTGMYGRRARELPGSRDLVKYASSMTRQPGRAPRECWFPSWRCRGRTIHASDGAG